jgi:hypothetical protein
VTDNPDAIADDWLRTLAIRHLGVESSLTPVAVGWASVDLERAVRDLTAWLPGPAAVDVAPDDDLLGARCRVARRRAALPWVVLEPITEGRLAAFLARHGEGLAVGWLGGPGIPERIAPLQPAQTALGSGRLVTEHDRFGPHLVILESAPWPAPDPTATIGP